jgi:hypothetical protein
MTGPSSPSGVTGSRQHDEARHVVVAVLDVAGVEMQAVQLRGQRRRDARRRAGLAHFGDQRRCTRGVGIDDRADIPRARR